MADNKVLIKAEEAERVKHWHLPDFSLRKATRVASAEKEAREAKKKAQAAAKEVIEDVEAPVSLSAEEVEAIRAEAERQGLQEGRTLGYDQGIAEGQEAGRLQALEQYRAQFDAQLKALSDLVAALAPPQDAQKREIQQHLVKLISRVTRHLVRAELSTPGEHIENLVSACLSSLPALKHPTRIYLHPDDLAYLKGEAIITEHLNGVELFADETLSSGGCRAVRGSSQIDARVDAQLDEVLSTLAGGAEDGADLSDVSGSTDRDGPDVE